MEETIDLRKYFKIIKKRLGIIILITTIATIISILTNFFLLSPVYESTTTMFVDSGKKSTNEIITSDQIDVSQKLALIYGEIIKSKSVLDQVTNILGIESDYEEVLEKIKVTSVKDTQIILVSVQDTNKQRATDIANTIPRVFTKEVKRITKTSSVKVIDKATLPKMPIKPNKVINVLMSTILGIVISLFIIFLIEYLDNKIKTPKDIEKYLELPLLGVVPYETKVK